MLFRSDCLPETQLKENSYDLVCFLDAIPYFPITQHRLIMSEIQRVLKPKGHLLMSSCLDLNSDGAQHTFLNLIKTEFSVLDYHLAFHHFFVSFRSFFKKTHSYLTLSQDIRLKKEKLEKASVFTRPIFKILSQKKLLPFFKPLSKLSLTGKKYLENSPRIILFLESLGRKLYDEDRASHIICFGKKKSLFPIEIGRAHV